MNKKVLIIEDERPWVTVYKTQIKEFFEEDVEIYEVNSSSKLDNKILRREYDLLILDGLFGEWSQIYDKINSRRKLIVTGTDEILKKCKNMKIEAYSKSLDFKLREILK